METKRKMMTEGVKSIRGLVENTISKKAKSRMRDAKFTRRRENAREQQEVRHDKCEQLGQRKWGRKGEEDYAD